MRARRGMTVLVAVTVVATGSGVATAAERVLLEQKAQTRVKAWDGRAIFSRWDGSRWHLVMSVSGRPPVDLPVPPQSAAFDADIGPDASGRAAVVFSRCDRRRGCDLYLLSLVTGRTVRVAGASDPSRNETRPSIAGGRIAWAQGTGVPSRRHSAVFVRRLAQPASVRSARIATFPADLFVEELELDGSRVALLTQRPGAICGRLDVRVVEVRIRRARRVASQSCGLNGQSWAGLTFQGPWLYFARYCHDPEACASRKYGAIRYRLRSGRFEISNFERLLTGWAYDANGRAYESRDPGGGECYREDLPGTCEVVRVSGLTFRRIARLN